MMVPFLLFPRLAPTISTPPHLKLCIHPSYPPSEKNKYVEVCETTGVEEEDPFPSSLSLGRDGSSERCLPSPSRCPTARSPVHRDPDDQPDADDQRPPGPHMPHHATSRPTMSHPLFSSLPTPTATTTLALTVTSRVATIAPAPLCPCGAGTSRRCTARTPQNAGRTYFKCPRRQGTPAVSSGGRMTTVLPPWRRRPRQQGPRVTYLTRLLRPHHRPVPSSQYWVHLLPSSSRRTGR